MFLLYMGKESLLRLTDCLWLFRNSEVLRNVHFYYVCIVVPVLSFLFYLMGTVDGTNEL